MVRSPLSVVCFFSAALLFFGVHDAVAQHHAPELHHPSGWRFTLPKGDAAMGRAAFDKYACYECHEVRGEKFPVAAPGNLFGPELSQMGPLHPLEFFAESVINPSAHAARKYRGDDGKSLMPAYNERMTVQELIDLSAYMASLKPKAVAQSVTGEGRVIAVMLETREIVLDHDAIKDFMDAMTMGYRASSSALLKGVKPGDKIRFTFDVEKRVITKIEKLKS